ncbi:MAG: 6-phosphogluconolactonase, partial [Flavobacteriaceae bacterium]
MTHLIDSAATETRKFEKVSSSIFEDSNKASYDVAKEIVDTMLQKQRQGKNFVLGLATGSTPIKVYEYLVEFHQKQNVSFYNVITFNLDEYYPMTPESIHSYVRFMNEHLFDHLDIKKENIHIPDGTLKGAENIRAFCEEYEQKIEAFGGIDLQVLGIGRTGHIGFNEPGSILSSKTRMVRLDRVTKLDAASDFFGLEHVPQRAITMGVGTIMAAKKVILMAWG